MPPRSLLDATPANVVVRCAALALSGQNGSLWNETPPALPPLPPDLDILFVHRALGTSYAAWLSAAARGEDAPARSRAAQVALLAVMGELPPSLSLLPVPVFPGASFASPRDWARAEWAALWEGFVPRLVSLWESLLDDLVLDPSWEVVALVPFAPNHPTHNAESFARVVSLFPSVPLGPRTLVAAPLGVARWLRSVNFTLVPPGNEVLASSPVPVDAAVLETAATLFQDGCSFPAALSAARSALSRS